MPINVKPNPLTKRLRASAIMALEQNGWTVELVPLPGRAAGTLLRGRYGDGPDMMIGLRTSSNRAIAFQPAGNGWKALDDVDVVVVAAVTDVQKPDETETEKKSEAEILLFRPHVVREAFDAARAARIKAGIPVNDDVGMWLALDPKGDKPRHVGSGFAKHRDSRWVVPLPEAPDDVPQTIPALADPKSPTEEPDAVKPTSIAAVLAAARQQIAVIAGLPLDTVTLTLTLTTA